MKIIKYLIFGGLCFLLETGYCQQFEILSADSLYNLGNSAYSMERFDEAIYYYEKSRLLNPTAEDVGINLQLANENLSTDIIELKPFFLAEWWNGLSHLMLPGGWKIASVVFILLALFLVYLKFFKRRFREGYINLLMALCIFLFVISMIAGNTRYNQIFNSPYAIVMGGEQSLYQGPDVVSEKVKTVTGGNKLRILDSSGDWYKVSAMDSEQGWIKQQNVRQIKFDAK